MSRKKASQEVRLMLRLLCNHSESVWSTQPEALNINFLAWDQLILGESGSHRPLNGILITLTLKDQMLFLIFNICYTPVVPHSFRACGDPSVCCRQICASLPFVFSTRAVQKATVSGMCERLRVAQSQSEAGFLQGSV